MTLSHPLRPLKCALPAAILGGLLTLCAPVHAIISVTSAGYTNDFAAAPVTGDWITSTSNIAGSETTFTSAASIDTFVVTNNYNATGLTTAAGSSATNPPTMNALARLNTALGAVQMRPNGNVATPGKAATVLLAKMQNDSGALIPRLDVAYDFAIPGAGTEEAPGWNAYYSTTGNSGWIKIPEFSTATAGRLNASLTFGGAGWGAGATLYILWVDDNAAAAGDVNDGTGEASYTMDNFAVTVPVVAVITAAVSNITRSAGTLVKDPSDDTITFDVTINGQNLPPGVVGWTTTGAVPSPAVTGTYGSTITVPNVPVSVLPFTITLADQTDPAIVGNLTVTAASLPHFIALNTIGAPSYVLLDGTSAIQWAPNGAAMNIVQTNGGGTAPFVASTAPVTFAAGNPKCVTLTLEAAESSAGTNWETEDLLKVELITDAGNQVLTGVLDKNGNGSINGYSDAVAPDTYDANPFRDEFNHGWLPMAGTFTNVWQLHGVIPAAATTAHIVVTGLNNSASETYRVHSVVFENCVDTDNDGAWDSQELVEGTDPNSAASRYRLLSHEVSGGNYLLTVPTVANRFYQLDTSADLLIWTPQAAAVAGTGADMSFTTPSDVPRKFARVTVQ